MMLLTLPKSKTIIYNYDHRAEREVKLRLALPYRKGAVLVIDVDGVKYVERESVEY